MKKKSLQENINYRAVEYLGEYYNMLNTVKRLNKEIAFAIKQGVPKNKLTASYDDNKGGYVSPSHDDALKSSSSILQKKLTILEYLGILEEITDALANMNHDERLAIIMRYVDNHTVKVICTELKYSSRQSVYTLLSSAEEKFARNLGINT